jgi:hypothetical protein
MPENEPNAARVQKWVKVYDPDSHVVYEGVPLDDADLERLASWFHEHACIAMLGPDEGTERKVKKQAARRGYCDECREFAAYLLATCPYLDMSRPDQQVFTDEGMSSQPRSAAIPDNKAPVAINERRRVLGNLGAAFPGGLLSAETFDDEVSVRKDGEQLQLAPECADILLQRAEQEIRLLFHPGNGALADLEPRSQRELGLLTRLSQLAEADAREFGVRFLLQACANFRGRLVLQIVRGHCGYSSETTTHLA